MNEPRIVIVKWLDAFGCPAGWEFAEDVHLSGSDVSSIGWVIAEDEDFILLAPHKSSPASGNKQLAGHIVIPKRQITSMQEVKP